MPQDVHVSGRDVESLGDDVGRKSFEEAGAEHLVLLLAIGLRVAEVAGWIVHTTYIQWRL